MTWTTILRWLIRKVGTGEAQKVIKAIRAERHEAGQHD